MLRAVIWDLDGVIVDTAQAHFAAWHRLFRELGRDLTWEEFRPTFGRRNPEVLRDLLGTLPDDELRRLDLRKEAIFRELAVREVRPLPGAAALLDALRTAGIPQALASSAPRENVEVLLKSSPLRPFLVEVTAEDVAVGKPDPAVFLEAARRLGVAPQDTVVIEDSPAGVEAAISGGFPCLAVVNATAAEQLTLANRIVNSLSEITLADLKALADETEARYHEEDTGGGDYA